jgi:hypothetical protein
MWFLLQGVIIFAVVASNIRWEWTPNTYLASAIGAGLAFLTTWIVNELLAWQRGHAQRAARKQQIR